MKQADAPCPNCNAHPCAEFAQLGQPPRWRCGSCGHEGALKGEFSGRTPTTKALSSEPLVKRHWGERC